ncbi:hypothetical protein [Legionella maceachernii]|uniref:Uncharacterized protein n=1 Tax=Legionella maceachernii TaxID=466 RepID=A0A0W0VX85_9GAMM|nr:hypothetical protein [Legionella maceachernii]KTD24839.1 hypothetical protein Lmac_2376 [Legionella maceachernii]SKA22492.1 hypothetical protein SAMN02745128_02665 [Legionella maceachernii]SUP01470.1 Uncharacterised protein [Legionella maceachernii]
MRTFFCSLLPKKEELTPFTTQGEVLEKYGQGVNDQGQVVGMCRPMSNAYLDLLLKGKKPKDYLADDKKFLALSIEEENRELESGESDVDHFAFKENNIPHFDLTIEKNDLTEKTLTDLLEENNHLLITYPQPSADHEIYLGRKNQGRCRFFDANIKGGERKGGCDKLIAEVIDVMKSQYVEEDKPFRVGMGRSG